MHADEAVARLREGNERFVADRPQRIVTGERRAQLRDGQQPFAVILGCSDSRVPPEIIFDQGLGDLFVIRVAGNVVAPSERASVEFAVRKLGCEVVVVLGHQGCGAIAATLGRVELTDDLRQRLAPLTELIHPAVEGVEDDDGSVQAIRANVEAGVEVLTRTLEGTGVSVVGAVYQLDTGAVGFLG